MNKLRLQLKIRYYTLIVWGRGTQRILYYRPKAWARGMRVKLKVILMILRGESVCYRAEFVDQVAFCGKDPAMIECSFYEEGGKWRYMICGRPATDSAVKENDEPKGTTTNTQD